MLKILQTIECEMDIKICFKITGRNNSVNKELGFFLWKAFYVQVALLAVRLYMWIKTACKLGCDLGLVFK